MEEINVHGCIFGDGIPKVCVPLVKTTAAEIIEEARQIEAEAHRLEAMYNHPELRVSMIEFRADYFDGVANSAELKELLLKLRKIFADRLILFTYRSEDEGGNLRHDRAEGMIDDIYEWVIQSGLVDLIDIELMSGNFHVVRLTTEAHEHGIACVVSNHDFTDTPRDDKIISMLRNMEILGADICKVVSMPANEFDVRRITELCTKVTRGNLHENNIRKPVVMISMGELGQISRISGRETGSAFTFASADTGLESAPGQLTLENLFQEWNKSL
ncbi:MAG: type I 3-dehydroquinate dehydratase [Lachnospiraceae bacterium]|nr:type I 3-dehydroquinate dehydratase [Lachnospiraceae bacterium]